MVRGEATWFIRGAYHFFDPSVDVSEQIRHFVSVVGQLEEGDLPPVLDLEGDKWKAISHAARVPMVFEWLEEVEHRLKVVPIIYLSPYFALDVLRTPKHPKLSKYKLWIAHNTKATRPLIPIP